MRDRDQTRRPNQCSLLVRHPTLQKITRIRRQLLELSANFVELPVSCNDKNVSKIRLEIWITTRI